MNQGAHHGVWGADAFAVTRQGTIPSDVGLQPLENKALSRGSIGKSAPTLAEITIRKSQLNFLHTIFIHSSKTADYQITKSILEILDNGANKEDILALFSDKNLPLDDITAASIADELLIKRPEQGYLTISNALQWRLQYGRAIQVAGTVDGVAKLR